MTPKDPRIVATKDTRIVGPKDAPRVGEDPPSPDLVKLINAALSEDIGRGDLTTRILFPSAAYAEARILARQELIVSGLGVLKQVFLSFDPALFVEFSCSDGEKAGTGDEIARIQGDGRSILTAERVALNFIQHLSGISTLTSLFVKALKGTQTKVLDTRKTLPGWRNLEKQAVRTGGGVNHRMGLDDAILIKDNHIVLFGGIGKAVRAAREGAPPLSQVLVEAKTLEQVEEALQEGAGWILLDNMSPEKLRAAVKCIQGRAVSEASGGITLKTVRRMADTGVDYVSVGGLTHSAPAADISLDLLPASPKRT